MVPKRFLILALSYLFLTLPLTAQNDPFGGGGDDPFGADPFAVKPKDAPKPRERRGPARAPATKPRVEKVTGERGTDAGERIRSVLDGKTSLTLIETPLVDALQSLSEQHQIPIIANVRALEELGIGTDVPITLSLKNVSLRSFLRLMLSQLDLTYAVKDEVLMITTLEHAEQNLNVRMYAIPETLAGKSDQVIGALTASVVPQMWDSTGGPCSVSAVDHVLVVSGTEPLHEEVVDFIRKLEEAYIRHQSNGK